MGKQRKTVLIVEDEEAMASAMASTISLEGLETVIVHNGSEALKVAHKLHPDLVLLDVMMFGMSGFEVCSRLNTDPETSDIPVILVTAKATEDDRALGMSVGAKAYVTKPFSPVHLIEVIKEILGDKPKDGEPQPPSVDTLSPDQLIVYARDLKMLWQREQERREALQAAHERLEEMDQLKASLLITLTQELLTPFASVDRIRERVRRKGEACSPDVRELLDGLVAFIAGVQQRVENVARIAKLVNKRREPSLERHAISHVIQWAVQPIVAIAQARGVDFRVFVPSDLPEVRIDAEWVAEAVFQMAHNAVTFNHPDGQAKVRAYVSDDMIVIEVSDTGVGLSPKRVAALTRPFQHSTSVLRRRQRGSGVGWTFVRYVAEAHGGRADVASPGKGQGSTFSLALPVAR